MTLHRFFIDQDLITENLEITLPEEISHQITQVLRLKNNENLILLDNTGFEYLVNITDLHKKHTICEIIEKRKNENEPETKVHLFMALIARDNFELTLQKSVELGISQITPILTERTQFDRKFAESKYERWQKIMKEAAEQSERGIIPQINPILNFDFALKQAKENGFSLIAWEKEPTTHSVTTILQRHPQPHRGSALKKPHEILNIFIGPEGGFT